ncbi:hypothetical protein [Dokdonella sp.]|uniref:hypothetical protein n=1 Tax=Dokdonella sp. TaxID=2291710 RepID=UPI002F3E3767
MPDSPQATVPWAEQKATASDGTPLAWLGSWVAISGSTAFVSARNATVDGQPSQGAVYVFERSAGSWHQRQKLVGKESAAGDQFGAAVALHGNIALIAAPNATIDGHLWQGAVHVFVHSPTARGWTETQRLVASDGARLATFGTAVAFHGEYAFVGAGGANTHGEFLPRKVYVFRRTSRTGDHWVQTQILDNPDPADVTSSFGAALAASADFLLVGARSATLQGNIGQGIVYVYRLKDGAWSLDGKISDPHGAARDNFGCSIALQDHVALIGAQGAAVDGNQGAVYHYAFKGAGWQFVRKLTPTHPMRPALFGASVSVSGDSALVGAYAEKQYQGAAYLFKLKSGTYVQQQRLTAGDGVANDVFGYYGALDGATAVVGAYTKKVGGNVQQGAVYFYVGPSIGPALGVAEA